MSLSIKLIVKSKDLAYNEGMKKIICIMMLLCSQAYGSQFLTLISDIDDTVKMTALKASKKYFTWYGPGSVPFYGISDLYTYFLCHDVIQKKVCVDSRANDQTFRGMIYVTGAPPGVHRLGLHFLNKHNFPSHKNVVYKPKLRLSTYEYKKKVISDIISIYPNKPYILLGDNGEYDSKAYRDVKKRLPSQVKDIFIHYVYPTKGEHHKIEDGQIAYLTAVDLGIHFLNKGLIDEGDLEKIIHGSLLNLNNKMTYVLRDWMVCKDFFRKNYFPTLNGKNNRLNPIVEQFKKKLLAHERCQ